MNPNKRHSALLCDASTMNRLCFCFAPPRWRYCWSSAEVYALRWSCSSLHTVAIRVLVAAHAIITIYNILLIKHFPKWESTRAHNRNSYGGSVTEAIIYSWCKNGIALCAFLIITIVSVVAKATHYLTLSDSNWLLFIHLLCNIRLLCIHHPAARGYKLINMVNTGSLDMEYWIWIMESCQYSQSNKTVYTKNVEQASALSKLGKIEKSTRCETVKHGGHLCCHLS